MAENDTLLAFMTPTNRAEVSATKALAYILTKSDAAMEAFNYLIKDAIDPSLTPVYRVEAEVSYTTENAETGRPDIVGYDANGENRVIVEAKFGANLQEGQGGGYLGELSDNGKSVLMFLVPDYRIESLWNEVKSDVRRGNDNFGFLNRDVLEGIQAAQVIDSDSHLDKYLLMTSWRQLLEEIEEKTISELSLQSDIHQLRGLTERMDMERFRPIEENEYTKDFARRMRDLRRIYDGVVERCISQGLMNTQNLSTSGQPETGYGRYVSFSGKDSWFGVYFNLWIDEAFKETPFWLNLYSCDVPLLNQIRTRANLPQSNNTRLKDPTGKYFPISVKLDASLKAVIDSMVCQIERIAQAIKEATEDKPT